MYKHHVFKHIRYLLMMAMLLISSVIFGANQADAILGVWTTQDGKARVEIVQQNGLYLGQIVWLKEPLYPADDDQGMSGKAKVDRMNPDASLKTRPIIGLPLVNGFHYAGADAWTGGTIYDPESGKTYSCKISLMSDGALRVRGYVGILLFGRTEIWQRYMAGTAMPAATAKTQ
ncbi:MAG TPA: DUF2147 domain-containing protein [Gammaproteobacteria bacterium]|nr:DUF2147 domain-containing protein [Gammaproteobacteria bacterium]